MIFLFLVSRQAFFSTDVVVLYCRVITSISNLFAPEVIHGKMDEIMKIFTRCINFYGGFVDKYMGDGIMALFGAKKATEHDTQRALLSALKMEYATIRL